MPKIVAFIGLPSGYIRNNPCDVRGFRTKPFPRRSQRLFGDIKHSKRVKALGDQGIDKARRTASNIDN